jgi:hypothetical protein
MENGGRKMFKRIAGMVLKGFIVFGVVFFTSSILQLSTASAMDSWKVNKIATINCLQSKNTIQEVKVKSSTGESLKLTFDLQNSKAKKAIKTSLKKDSDAFSDIFGKGKVYLNVDVSRMDDNITVYQIVGQNPYTTFWAIVGTNGNMQYMDSFFIIGPYGENYVAYMTKDSLNSVGWNTTYLNVTSYEGRLILDGVNKVNEGYGYQKKVGQRYFLNWDDNANWFSSEYIPADFDIMSL